MIRAEWTNADALNSDTVTVVRCKDCKHLVRSEGVCKVLSNNYEPPVYVEDDDYCSRGERGEDKRLVMPPADGSTIPQEYWGERREDG